MAAVNAPSREFKGYLVIYHCIYQCKKAAQLHQQPPTQISVTILAHVNPPICLATINMVDRVAFSQ